MRQFRRVTRFSIVLAALTAACESTPPATGTQISGVITELGEIPNPPMDVKIRFWKAGDPSAHDAADLLTDGSGAFALDLANIEPPVLDSIRVTATTLVTSVAMRRSPGPSLRFTSVFGPPNPQHAPAWISSSRPWTMAAPKWMSRP
jgi:hypothetical protein